MFDQNSEKLNCTEYDMKFEPKVPYTGGSFSYPFSLLGQTFFLFCPSSCFQRKIERKNNYNDA